MKCPTCGKSLWFVKDYCVFCKTAFTERGKALMQSLDQSSPPPSKDKRILALIFISAIALIGLFAYNREIASEVLSFCIIVATLVWFTYQTHLSWEKFVKERPSVLAKALSEAVAAGSLETVSTLLAKGANPNAAPNKGRVPVLQKAAYHGYYDIVELLLDKGANVNARAGADQATALHSACGSGNAECVRRRRDVVRLLLQKGADVNAKDCRGWTPFFLAKYFEGERPQDPHAEREITQLLRDAGGRA